MILIYTANQANSQLVREIVASQPRLDELVSFKDALEERPLSTGAAIMINAQGICFPLDWHNFQPPYLLPEYTLFQDEILLAFIYFKLGNAEMAFSLLQPHGAIRAELTFIHQLKNGMEADPATLTVETYQDFDDYRLMHNHAVVRHYGSLPGAEVSEKIHYYYNAAMDAAPNDEYQAFSARHYVSFLIDQQSYALAQKIAEDTLSLDISADAAVELHYLLCQLWLSQLTAPYNASLLEKIKTTLWSVLQAYEKADRRAETAMLLEDACHIANISESFAEALGYITRAIKIYEEEMLEELLYNAYYKKGQLLFTWAKKGQVQFFRAAIESYQQAVRYFTKEDYPEIYADIQHYLGVIYAEIPDEVKKKSIWAAVSYAAFMEALAIFTKENTPYEYALVCNSLGNALMKYPAAIHSDNFEKALFYYNEALDIRTPQRYPLERSLSLLNYLEASWNADNTTDEQNPGRYADMWQKAEEVIALNASPQLAEEAKDHLQRLLKLKELMG
jgi:tetratricopeptide (TPR) repeat protein